MSTIGNNEGEIYVHQCNFSLGITLITSPEAIDVIGGVMISLINSWKIKWGPVIQEVRMLIRWDNVSVMAGAWLHNFYVMMSQSITP